MENYVSKGDTVDYTNAGPAIASGAVVPLKHSIGIAMVDIANGATGAVRVTGKVTVPKVTAAVFAVGEKLIWDASVGKFDDSAATPATGDITGACIAAVAGTSSDDTAVVILTPGNATLTA